MAKKSPGWEDRGKAYAAGLNVHLLTRAVFERVGLGTEALDWSLEHQGTATTTTGTPFGDVMEELAMRYHEQRLVTQWYSRTSVCINTAAEPLLPYPNARDLEVHGRTLDLTIKDGVLYAYDKPMIVLQEVDLAADPHIVRTIDDVCPRELANEGINTNLSFFLRRHPEFVPDDWKRPRDDGFTPHIVLPGTRYTYKFSDVVSATSWDEHEGRMVDSWTQAGIRLAPPDSTAKWSPLTGTKPRKKIYIARLQPDWFSNKSKGS